MSARSIHGALAVVGAAALAIGCEAADRALEDRGERVYSCPFVSLYRSDRRVETVVEHEWYLYPPACGHLTERAADDIDRVVASLDPERDYEIDTQACEDRWADGVWGRVHVEGFAHEPFHCTLFLGEECCTGEIVPLMLLYARTMAYLEGHGEDHDAFLESIGLEAYPMLEPDAPCR